jgi:hypothetical protein
LLAYGQRRASFGPVRLISHMESCARLQSESVRWSACLSGNNSAATTTAGRLSETRPHRWPSKGGSPPVGRLPLAAVKKKPRGRERPISCWPGGGTGFRGFRVGGFGKRRAVPSRSASPGGEPRLVAVGAKLSRVVSQFEFSCCCRNRGAFKSHEMRPGAACSNGEGSKWTPAC